jgi:hypothetical protein
MDWLDTYKDALEARGGEASDLMGVIPQALHHNFPNSFSLGILAGELEGGYDAVMKNVASRVGLVNRHIGQVQGALRDIRNCATERGYEDILEIFNREYHIGHAWSEGSGEDSS